MSSLEEDQENEEFPITDAIDISILMHRDAHFGGNFDVMLEYYQKGGKGINPEFELERIFALQQTERKLGRNLAAVLLSGSDAERVSESREAYRKLRSLYEKKESSSKYPKMIADLILAEEENPVVEIDAIVAEKAAIVPALMDLLRSQDFHDPLFPGYGLAPELAMICLGKIGDKRSIIGLFESIGESDFFEENVALEALKRIGVPAREFLLKVLHARPLTFDNERAAMALLQFENDPVVTNTCLKMLGEIDLKKDSVLASYLIMVCEGLVDPKERKDFIDLANNPKTPPSLKKEMLEIAHEWETNFHV